MIRPRQVLIVAPTPGNLDELALALRASGHEVRLTSELSGHLSPDLALVDVAGRDELWAVAELLSSGRLILVVPDARSMRRGFGMGADDCVMVGADVEETVARCEASLRRTAHADAAADGEAPAVYADGRLWVNFALRQVWSGGRSAQLTTREQRLLRFLVQHADATLSHDTILAGVWGRKEGDEQPSEVLKQYIWRLRQKVEADPRAPEIVVTVPGRGYRFVSHLG